ncbi:SAM complex subunit Sam50 [Schizosaccharomyces japonicus yFS275]|uniref:SAM complex subunit Sam50 n=1 Tax=Schizosaccharomyces japonicus (strain yFS275 / FY16936) TaxID=402676 RepID=B6JZC2_SCHJY|nr:SAM complex subunit Sam50 [Schizosaccharomyces japonicus yFS275]EEB06890.1 SAM complex subunit Sam50 [Schizosaccharomyces japonicus yFS275]
MSVSPTDTMENTPAGIDTEQLKLSMEDLAQILNDNSTLPLGIASIRVVGATRTRPSFLEKAVSYKLAQKGNIKSIPLGESLETAQQIAERLMEFGIYEDAKLLIDRASGPIAGENDIDITILVKEKSRLLAKTGTDIGNVEGNVYANILARNAFGGAEFIEGNLSYGTRNRMLASLTFDTPINADPYTHFRVNAINVLRDNKLIASHDILTRDVNASITHKDAWNGFHELKQSLTWRQVTNLVDTASPSIRLAAGDSLKQAFSYSYTLDKRDNPALPTKGGLLKYMLELAGMGPIIGDAKFVKNEIWSQLSIPLNVSHSSCATVGLRAGAIHDLDNETIGICDRFYLGGPTSLRGFTEGRIGPKDGKDCLGGTAYLAASASLTSPVPGVNPSKPFRMQFFINAGGLRMLDQRQPLRTFRDIIQKPCVTSGIGLIYATGVARFELNFTLPLMTTVKDLGRRGFQLGAGLEFL